MKNIRYNNINKLIPEGLIPLNNDWILQKIFQCSVDNNGELNDMWKAVTKVSISVQRERLSYIYSLPLLSLLDIVNVLSTIVGDKLQ